MWHGLCISTLILLSLSAAPPPGAVDVRPRFSLAPASIALTAHIPRHTDNRSACLTVDGPEFSESCWTLDGSSAVTTRATRVLRAPGRYLVTLTVHRPPQTFYTSTDVCVVDDQDCP